MRPDDFYNEEPHEPDPWGPVRGSRKVLNTELLNTLRAGPAKDHDDVETAVALTRLSHTQLEKCGTDDSQVLNDAEMSEVLAALQATLKRLGLPLTLPFHDFQSFRKHWKRNGCPTHGRNVATYWTVCSTLCTPS